jgi:hypothetical protein
MEFNSVGYGMGRGGDRVAPFLERESTGRLLGFDFPWSGEERRVWCAELGRKSKKEGWAVGLEIQI